MVEFRMLGSMSLRGPDGRELRPLLAQPKRVALLAYLAANPRFHRRDSLVALFWPDLDQEHARGALRQALHGLRRGLGDAAFQYRGDDDIGLNQAGIYCDVIEFERLAGAGQLVQALELYRGDLLEGFFIRGAPEFERWLEDERARVKRVAIQAATALAEQSEAKEAWQDSAQWANRALRIAPLDEGALRQLMRMLDRLGNRAGALEAYEGFARRLATELEA
ncbi:MAG TPA: BTAD domain-containing putative transcriptional regulator, partial [Gemmatimonadales bacterium]|nr:BTAD domain-containing putative transcriptional regulator [Gemmatimonadales bacterium]